MRNTVAKFEVISESLYNHLLEMNIYQKEYGKYSDIKKPVRATISSAGYDFFLNEDVVLEPGESTVIYTFIRCRIDTSWALLLLPKSGLGFKYTVRLANTIGLIDSDFYNPEDPDSGHIIVKLVNEGCTKMELHKGDKFCQGIFVQYGITEDDEASEIRNGGFGSTGK